jgi:pectinesterase
VEGEERMTFTAKNAKDAKKKISNSAVPSIFFLAFLAFLLSLAVQSFAAHPKMITVSQDGSADFTSVQAAIDSILKPNDNPVVIVIKPGTYKERIEVPRDKRFVTLRGDTNDPKDIVLTYDLNANSVVPPSTQPVGTSGSASAYVHGDDFTAENVTFENSAGDRGQAVAMKYTADRGVFRNCRFLGWQDTLYPGGRRVYFDRCYVEGRVDFIFGKSPAVFDRCTIHSKNGGYVTAANTPPDQAFGFVFLDCRLTGEGVPTYLGRPWQWDRGSKSAVAFIRCEIGPHIRPEGWNQWDRPNNPNTNPAENTRYFEYKCTGPGADRSKRVAWSRELSDEEAKKFTVENVLRAADGWDPGKK